MKLLYTALALLFLWSCQEVIRPEKPENLIPEDKMVEVLTEVYLLNAARSTDNRVILKSKLKLDDYLYKKFDIDSLQFLESNAFYTSNLNTYNGLFTRIQERMELLKAEKDTLVQKILEKEKAQRKLDSINEVNPDSLKVKIKDTLKPTRGLIDPIIN